MSLKKRIDRNEYFMSLAEMTAKRSTCDRASVGAIAVKNKRIIMSGYNGSPPGTAHCHEEGHILKQGHCVRTVHAEQNIICQAAKKGIALEGATLYVSHLPCELCHKLLLSSGIKEIIYGKHYGNARLFAKDDIPTRKINGEQ